MKDESLEEKLITEIEKGLLQRGFREFQINRKQIRFLIQYEIKVIDRNCQISFVSANYLGEELDSQEILVRIIEYEEIIEMGYTFSIRQVIGLVIDWLSRGKYQVIYKKYEFLGGQLRSKKDFKNRLLREAPEFKKLMRFENVLEKGKRSCIIESDKRSLTGECSFLFQQIRIFRVRNIDIGRLSLMMKNWLEKEWSPKRMKRKYSEIGLLRYLELFHWWNRPSEQKMIYLRDWEKIEDFYRERFIDSTRIISFLEEIKNLGYTEHLRPGTSMESLMISRSKNYGLRRDQKSITLNFLQRKPSLQLVTIAGVQMEFEEIEFNSQIDKEFQKLLGEPIN